MAKGPFCLKSVPDAHRSLHRFLTADLHVLAGTNDPYFKGVVAYWQNMCKLSPPDLSHEMIPKALHSPLVSVMAE